MTNSYVDGVSQARIRGDTRTLAWERLGAKREGSSIQVMRAGLDGVERNERGADWPSESGHFFSKDARRKTRGSILRCWHTPFVPCTPGAL